MSSLARIALQLLLASSLRSQVYAAKKCQGTGLGLKYVWGDALTDSIDCLGPNNMQYPTWVDLTIYTLHSLIRWDMIWILIVWFRQLIIPLFEFVIILIELFDVQRNDTCIIRSNKVKQITNKKKQYNYLKILYPPANLLVLRKYSKICCFLLQWSDST